MSEHVPFSYGQRVEVPPSGSTSATAIASTDLGSSSQPAAYGVPVGDYAELGAVQVQSGMPARPRDDVPRASEKLLPTHAVRSHETEAERRANFIASQSWDKQLRLWWRKVKCCTETWESIVEAWELRPCWCYNTCLTCYCLTFFFVTLWLGVVKPALDPTLCGGRKPEPGAPPFTKFAVRQIYPSDLITMCIGCDHAFVVQDGDEFGDHLLTIHAKASRRHRCYDAILVKATPTGQSRYGFPAEYTMRSDMIDMPPYLHDPWIALFGKDDSEAATNGLRKYVGTAGAGAPPLLAIEGFWNGRTFYVGEEEEEAAGGGAPAPSSSSGEKAISMADRGWRFVGEAHGSPLYHQYEVCMNPVTASATASPLMLLVDTVVSDLMYDNNGVSGDKHSGFSGMPCHDRFYPFPATQYEAELAGYKCPTRPGWRLGVGETYALPG